jgi:hypothetical protein
LSDDRLDLFPIVQRSPAALTFVSGSGASQLMLNHLV